MLFKKISINYKILLIKPFSFGFKIEIIKKKINKKTTLIKFIYSAYLI